MPRSYQAAHAIQAGAGRMRRRFTHRRSVGLTPSVAARVQRLAISERRSFEQTLRLLVVVALRSRESLAR